MRLLGEFEVRDSWVFKAFDQATFLTMAAEGPDFDYEAAWKAHLDNLVGREKVRPAHSGPRLSPSEDKPAGAARAELRTQTHTAAEARCLRSQGS